MAKRIAVQMRNTLLRDGVLAQLSGCHELEPIELGRQMATAAACRSLRPDVLLMETSDFAPDCVLSARLATSTAVRETVPGCRVALIVDENTEQKLAEDVKKAKVDGLIDLFIYASTSGRFLAAQLETL